MSIEPSLIPTIARLDAADAAQAIDWTAYRKCSQICRAEIGEACFSLSGRIVGGRPDRVRTELSKPHASRKLRVRRK